MNTAEHIVESYYRLCEGCFTLSDRKIQKGSGRQFDLLAVNLLSDKQFHIEVAVTHRKHWCPTINELGPYFEKKFFGLPPERKSDSGSGTDFEKNKIYNKEIETTYTALGMNLGKIQKVLVCWYLRDQDNTEPITVKHKSITHRKSTQIEVLSLRDYILPKLLEAIGTHNYEDEMLRAFSFIKQRNLQTK